MAIRIYQARQVSFETLKPGLLVLLRLRPDRMQSWIMRPCRFAWLAALLIAIPAVDALAEARLWDREPSLAESARSATMSHQVPAGDPQPIGTSFTGAAPNLSTQTLKVSLWGPAAHLTLSVNKTDVWDRRRFPEPVLTLERIREIVKGGSVPPDYYDSWMAYDFPCAKPVGQILLSCPDLEGAEQPQAITHCDNGTTSVAIQRGDTRASLVFLPMMTQNMIAVQCDYEGLRTPVSVRLYRHRDTQMAGKSMMAYGGPDPKPFNGYDYLKDEGNGPMEPPTSGAEGSLFWIQQRFPAEKTFPKGFSYAMAGCVLGPEVTIETVDGQLGLGTLPQLNREQQKCFDEKGAMWALLPSYKPIHEATGSAATAIPKEPVGGRQQFTVLTSIVTSVDAEDPLAEAKKRLTRTAQSGFGALLAENAKWYEQFYQKREKGRVFTGDAESARSRIPEVFGSWGFKHATHCLPDPSKYEAIAQYTFLEQDWAPWHGLPCYNELYWTASHVQNRSDTSEYYSKLVEAWLPACKENASEVFHLPGALIQHGYLPPVKADRYVHTIANWEFCMEIPAQVLKVLWDRYDYGGDRSFLEKVAYPAMRETAIFYSHYATLGDDGYYHVMPTVSAEHWGWTKDFERNRDSTSALCMFKWLLNTTADASVLLQRDADLRGRWREVAGKLAPYPTYETPEGPVFTDVRGVNPIGTDYNFFAGFTPTLLADEINLDSPSEQKEIMLRTARLVKGWLATSVGPLLASVQGTETEQLINSRSGRIHLFPAVPQETTIAFRDMQARGGFEVSAECIRGQTTFVQLHARQDSLCRLVNPWPGQAVTVCDSSSRERIQHTIAKDPDECVTFPAQAAHVYLVQCETHP